MFFRDIRDIRVLSLPPHSYHSPSLRSECFAIPIFFAMKGGGDDGYEPCTPPAAGQVVLREMERGVTPNVIASERSGAPKAP